MSAQSKPSQAPLHLRAILILALTASILAAISSVIAVRVESDEEIARLLIGLVGGIEAETLRNWQQRGGIERELSLGDRGVDVSLVQKALSTDRGIYPEGFVTGYYGRVTAAAVKRFQRQYGLPETALVDTPTLKALNGIYYRELCPEQDQLYPDMALSTVSKTKGLSISYVPNDLERVDHLIPTSGVICLSSTAVPALQELVAEARRDRVYLMVTSGYRHPMIQQLLFDYWVSIDGRRAFDEIAMPGLSEHQLGTTVDFTGASIDFSAVDGEFGHSREGKWLEANAAQFGFIQSYPNGRKFRTGYNYEPWHYRFVGREAAAAIIRQSAALVEYTEGLTPKVKMKEGVNGLRLGARSLIALRYKDGDIEKIVSRQPNLPFPAAQFSRIMTAVLTSQRLPDHERMTVSGNDGLPLFKNRSFTAGVLENLLFFQEGSSVERLIESHFGTETYITLMNEKAHELGMYQTLFISAESGGDVSVSSAADIARLLTVAAVKAPQLLDILRANSYEFTDAFGRGKFTSTRLTLADFPLSAKIRPSFFIGSDSPMGKGFFVTELPRDGGVIVAVLVDSPDIAAELSKLLLWLYVSFNW